MKGFFMKIRVLIHRIDQEIGVANRDHLLKAVKNANDNIDLVHLPLDNLK
jgi:hypothetical protein